MESNSTAFLIKIKLRHSLGRPSRSDFVQSELTELKARDTSCPRGKKVELKIIRTIGIWRRFLFMKKGINKSILFYIASVLFFIASAIGFTSGNESSMAIVWLCLGSSFLCLGSTHKKKENNTDDK